MGKALMVPIRDCPIGEWVIHEHHEWRQGFFLHKYGCSGWSQRNYDTRQILKSGSEGKLTVNQVRRYLGEPELDEDGPWTHRSG